MTKRLTALTTLTLFLGGCALNPATLQTKQIRNKLVTAYDYQLLNQQFQPITLMQVTTEITKADVIFIGEYHGNHASHLLQMQLLAKLHQHNKQTSRTTVLSMEQFERQQQSMLDNYLKGKIGERYLIEKAPTWGNYKASYRPLVEYAKQYKLPVVAANAPANIIRCIGLNGDSYLATLSSDDKKLIATKPFSEVTGYQDKFFGVMGLTEHAKAGKRMRQSYQAQLTRDNTMAESIKNALKQSPTAQVIHLNGNFHSAGHLGTVGALKRLNPKLNIIVVTPIHIDQLDKMKNSNKSKNDFYYLLNPQPKSYVNAENRKAAHKVMFAKPTKKGKSCN